MSNEKVAEALNIIVADAIVFYQKLHQYHWQVKGRNFFGLHAKLEEYYNQWTGILDDVAERVLTIGGNPVPTLAAALKLTTLKEEDSRPDELTLVKNVLADMQTQHGNMRKAIAAAEEADDRGTVNLLDGFCDEIEKTCWMLNAWLS